MAANMVPVYRNSKSASPDMGNMAAGVNLLLTHPEGAPSCPPAANPPALPHAPSMATMEYFCPRLQIGVSEPVVVTQVLDPHRLFCQLRSMSHEIQRLSESMHQYYEVQQQSYGDQGSRLSLALGQPCASYGEDGRWHRSLLQEFFPEQQQALVIHVDWGKKEVIPANRLRNLASEFFRLPVFTIPCTMYGISKVDFNWDPVFISDVRALLLQKHVVAKIECYNSYEHLYAVELFAEDGMDLNGLVRMRFQIHRSSQVKISGTTEPPPKSNTKIPAKKVYNPRYPPVELKTDKFEDAVVEFVIDPFNFWVQIEKFAAKHKEMINGMTMLYSQASKLEGIITEPKPGKLCCAQYQDLYYRAEIISVDTKKQVKVHFLDNGMVETLDWYNIRELPAGFSKLPALANRCCLADTYPLEDSWSQEAILAFKMAVADKKLVIYVVSKDADEYTIEVLDQSRIQETSVGKILAKAGLARFEEIDSIHSQVSGNGKDVQVESAKTVLNPSATEYVLKVQETTASDTHEESTDSLLYCPYEEQVFEPGTTIGICVSKTEHPGYFWCQDTASKKDLLALMSAIQSHCMSTNCPYIGDSFACLAKCKRNRMWYRALITEYPRDLSPTSTVEVLFVDFGYRETVSVSNLRAINSEFFQLKAQAFRCSVYNLICPLGNNPFIWDNKAREIFSDFVQKGSDRTEFHCTVYATAYLDNEIFNIVDLTTPFSSVCKTLVKSGCATPLNHTSLAPSVQLQSYYYSMHEIKYGSDEEIFIKHVDSSLMFYGQLTRSGRVIKQISSSISKFIEKSQKRKLPPITGALCLAKSKDQRWYRGLILSKEESNQIFFVDFGNIEKVSNKCLLPIPSTEWELLLMPMQAIKCFLSDIPSKVPAEIVSWFKDVVLDKALRARVVSKDSHGNLSVELYDGDRQINARIKSKMGLKVPKEKSSHMAPDQLMTMFQRDDNFTKLPDKISRQERTTSIPEGKTVKSRESNFDSHSKMGREPERPCYRKNPTLQNKVENKDHSSKDNGFTSQKKLESVPRGSTNGYQERHTKQDGNKTSSKIQDSAIASVHKSEAKLPVETLRDIPIRKIFLGMKEHVYISQTNSIFDFYVQVAEDSMLDELSDLLNSKMSSFEDLGHEDVSVGNVICAYFPDDGLYYRGVVKETTKQGLCVEYIDYGNVATLSDCKNYRLPPKCLTIPILSIRCSLNKPENATSALNPEEILAEFSKRTSDVRLDCEFLKQDGLKWDIILKDELGCINDLLIEEQENIEEANRMVMKMKIAKEEETSVQFFTWKLPPPGVSVKVYISTTDGPENFWCQLSTADMDTLASQVQEAGEQCVKNDEFIGALKIGSPCNVMFSEDQNWYRAIITKMDAELVTVRFIDYGNEDSVRRDQILQLPEPLVNLPPQAFSCCLANFDMKEGTWSSEGKQYFYERFTEDALELTVHEVQESGWCKIPMAIVTLTSKELNVNEEMRNFWQGVQSMDLEPDDLTSVDLMKSEQPRTSLAGEDHPQPKHEMEDDVYLHGEEQESDTDGIKDAMDLCEEHADLDEEVLDHGAPKDDGPLGREDFGSGEVNNDMADDVSPNLPAPVPRVQGAEVASDHDRYPDLTSSQQEPPQDTPESVESLILYFNEKLGLKNKGTISDDAAEKEVRSQSEIFEKITVPDAGNDEKFDDCTKDETKQVEGIGAATVAFAVYKESKAAMTSEDLTKEVIVDGEVSTKLLEIEPEEVLILQDEHIQENVESYVGPSICADDMSLVLGHVDLLKMEDSFDSVEVKEDKVPGSEACIYIEALRAEDCSGLEETLPSEASTEYLVSIISESEEDSTSFNITACGEITKDYEEVIQVDDEVVLPEVLIKDTNMSFEDFKASTVESPLGDLCEDLIGEGPASGEDLKCEAAVEVFYECFSSEGSICAEPELAHRFVETVKAESREQYVKPVGTKIDKGFVQSEENLTSSDFNECGVATTIDFEEVIQENKEAIEKAYIRFEGFEATIEGSSTDLGQDFVASADEEPVSGEDLKYFCEEFVVKEDIERKAASFEDFYVESPSTDDCKVPEFVQEFMESSYQVVNRGRHVCVQKGHPFPADDTETGQEEIEQDGTQQELVFQEAEVVDVPCKDYVESEDLTKIAELKIEEPPQSNNGMEKITFSEVNVTSQELKECRNTCGSIEGLDEVGDATLDILTQEGTKMETIQISDEIGQLLIRDIHKMENIMIVIEVDMENTVVMPSEDITVEDIVGSKVSEELLEIEPEDVLILQDEAIQDDMERYGGLNNCQDDMPPVLGHVDIAIIKDSIESVAWTEGDDDPATKDGIEAILAEDFSGHEVTVSSEVSTECLVTITSEDSGQNKENSTSFDITECGEMTTKDYEEVCQADEDSLFLEGVNKEAGTSFEEFESTIVEGSLTDFSQDFAASAGEELVSGEDLKLKDLYEKFVAKEDLKREAVSFEDFFCESGSTNDHEELEFVQDFMESSHHHLLDCGSDVCKQSEHPSPPDDTDRKQQETEQGHALAGTMAEDLLELAAEDVTSERDGKQQDSFSRYRECPTLLASMDSVYESDLNEPEKTDSESEECRGPGAKDRLWSYFTEAKFSVNQNVESEDIEECGDNTLSESICQTDDCETETADLGDHRDQADESQRDAPGSMEAELSPVMAAAAEEGKEDLPSQATDPVCPDSVL